MGIFAGKMEDTERFMGLYKKTWNYVRKGKVCFSENDIYTCAELVKTYKNRYVKMLVLLQGNKWVPKYAHK